MSKLWLIAKSNIKKRKGNVVSLFLLVVIAVVLMYSSISVLRSVNTFLCDKNERQNGAHVSIMATHNYQDEMMELIEEVEHFQSVEVEDKLQSNVTCNIRNVSQKNGSKDTMMMLFESMDDSDTISNWDIVDKAESKADNSIVLPMYLKVAKGYHTGDEIEVKMNQVTKKFIVYGFIEDVVFATPSNIATYSCKVTEQMYKEMKAEGNVDEMYLYNIRLDSVEHSSEYEGVLSKKINREINYPDFGTMYVVNFTMMLGGTTMMINIIMSILMVFAVILLVIVVLMIRFNMMMYLEENLPNIGIMKAAGYTTGQLRGAMFLEYLVTCVAGIIVGYVVSVLASAFFASLVSGSIGLTWLPTPDIAAAAIVGGFVLLFVIAVVLRTAARLKKITTLDALRGGIQTHNFRRNYMPLAGSKMGLHTSLGIKSLLHNTKQNVAVLVIVTMLSFASVMSLLFYYNFEGDATALLTLVGMEKNDIEVSSAGKNEEELTKLLKELETKEHIRHGVLYGWQAITIYNDTDELSVTSDVYNDFSLLSIHPIYQGREPERANEIVITTVLANRFGVSVGDSIQVKVGEISENYIICGISQQISNMGVRARLTREGAFRLNQDFAFVGIGLYTDGDADLTANVVNSLKDEYKDVPDLKISNINEAFETILGTFSDSLLLMCAVFVMITIVVVVLVVLMIMRMKIVRERRSIGVYKALGYTTGQIIWQMVIGFAPVVTLGGILGAAIGALSINRILILALSYCQMKNADLSVGAGVIAVCIVFITVLAFAVSAGVSAKARKIEPYKMIVEE